MKTPILFRKLVIPRALRQQLSVEDELLDFGGDLRIGDLTGDGRVDFLLFRALADGAAGASGVEGLKPCFLGAFDLDGQVLWTDGEGGVQPARPGPVAVYDLDGDGETEVVNFLATDPSAAPGAMDDVIVQVREGGSGRVKYQVAPPALRACHGKGPNWVHQRLLIANLRGLAHPQDIVVKLGSTLLAFDDRFNLLWRYEIRWNAYGRCAAYIPAVGDIDGDGRDEVNGGYFLLDHDGTPLWERRLAPHMDSVAITTWDHGRTRAICSGGGHVMDAAGNVVLRLGEELVPHGQEARVARFDPGDPEPQMVIRWNGHAPDVRVVSTSGRIVNDFRLNDTPNHTGMTVVYWQGAEHPAMLYNGGVLWDPVHATALPLPGLPDPAGPPRMGWYHCIPADVCGNAREEVLLYNPWDRWVWIYTPAPLDAATYRGYRPGPRRYNARLMD